MIHTDIKPENVLLDTNEGAAHQTAKEMKRLWTSGKALPSAAGNMKSSLVIIYVNGILNSKAHKCY